MTTPVSRNPKRQRKKEGHRQRREAELAALQRQRRNRLIIRFALVGGLILAVGLVLSLLGNDDDDDPVADTTTTTTTTTTTPAEDESIDQPNLTCATPESPQTDLESKPTITPPAEPVTDLTCLDHVVGDGDEVQPGDTIRAHYVGVRRSDGGPFDASWDRGEPSEFSLERVIVGWTEGIPGMRVGGRRELIIPSVMGYGPDGNGPDIPGDEDLVFIVDVVEIVE